MKKAWYAGFGLAVLAALMLFIPSCSKSGPVDESTALPTLIPSDEAGPEGSTTYAPDLMNDPLFIDWVRRACRNQLDVHQKWRGQLGVAGIQSFQQALANATTDAGVRSAIVGYRIDTVYADGEFAEHLASYEFLRNKYPGLWSLSADQRISLFRNAYYSGMNSTHPEWTALKNELISRAESYGTATGGLLDRISAAQVVDCLWGTIKSFFSAADLVSDVVQMANSGDWAATVSAIKQVLKTARKYSWVGLAWAAIDVGICLWNS